MHIQFKYPICTSAVHSPHSYLILLCYPRIWQPDLHIRNRTIANVVVATCGGFFHKVLEQQSLRGYKFEGGLCVHVVFQTASLCRGRHKIQLIVFHGSFSSGAPLEHGASAGWDMQGSNANPFGAIANNDSFGYIYMYIYIYAIYMQMCWQMVGDMFRQTTYIIQLVLGQLGTSSAPMYVHFWLSI